MINKNKSFYITTTLPYVNAMPHVGFVAEILVADVRARFERIAGFEVMFNTGTDEHGAKIVEQAIAAGEDPCVYVDHFTTHFRELKDLLNLSFTNFVRTTDRYHIEAAQELWRRVAANGYIYKKEYRIKYCVGCELEKTDSELENAKCPFHPNRELEFIEEENYFFRFSAFSGALLQYYKTHPNFVVPTKRFNEIKNFAERGLQDFSISRLKKKMSWGVPVPDDQDHVMYVWFDALTNYISTLGWPSNIENFEKFWGTKIAPNAIQIAGKDNLRQQSAMWQAMLLAADLPMSKQIFIAGFISVDGQKMSKSLGNVIAPSEMVRRFGIDGTRYLLLSKGHFGEDTDINWDAMIKKYNADLANGLGNLVSRIITLASKEIVVDVHLVGSEKIQMNINKYIRQMEMRRALEEIFEVVSCVNRYIDIQKPWELRVVNPVKFKEVMVYLLGQITFLSTSIEPFLPETARMIKEMIETRERVVLFQRIG